MLWSPVLLPVIIYFFINLMNKKLREACPRAAGWGWPGAGGWREAPSSALDVQHLPVAKKKPNQTTQKTITYKLLFYNKNLMNKKLREACPRAAGRGW